MRVAMACSTRARIFAGDRFNALCRGDRSSTVPSKAAALLGDVRGVQRAPYAVVGAIVLNHSGNWPLWELYILDGLLAAVCCGR